MFALFRFASRIPGGLDILMGEGFQMNLWEEEERARPNTQHLRAPAPIRPRPAAYSPDP